MDEKFMKVLREQQEIQQKAARILHDTEKMKEEVQNKLESLKRKVENDFKNIGEFLKEANVQFATYEYIFQEDDCKRIQINEQKYQTCAACKCKRHCEDFVMPNSTRCKCNFMDYLRRKRWRRIRRIFR